MARINNPNPTAIVAGGNLGATQRTIGGILGQFDSFGVGREQAIEILRGAGLPAVAYDDPSFPISLQQDFELLNEIRKHMWPAVSMEVALFRAAQDMRIHMFGALGLAWQSAPTILDAAQVSIKYPQMNWGRSRMEMRSSKTEDCMAYQLGKGMTTLSGPEDIEQTHKYALLLDITAAMAIVLDIVSDRALLQKIKLPFERPRDWSIIARSLAFKVEFNAPEASIVFKPGFFAHVPRHSHRVSFKLALKLVEKEAAVLAEVATLRERVIRWLWASTPPLKKTEIARLLGISERSLTRRLASEGTNYNQLFLDVQSERALNLLENRKMTVSEIAYRMGYSDPAAFSRAFVSRQGMSPSQWRSTMMAERSENEN